MTCAGCQRPVRDTDLNCAGCGAPVGALAAGTRLHHQYRIEQALARQGGQRYLALDEQSGSRVLVLEFFPEGARRFGTLVILDAQRQEQRAAWARLAEHWTTLHSLTLRRPLQVFEQHGTTYVVSPVPAGVPLSEQVERQGALGGDEVVRLVLVLAEVIEELAAAGSLDGPLEPERITLTSTGVRLELGWGQEAPVAYRAPEQLMSQPAVRVASRIYSLGAAAHFALTGEAPPGAAHRALGQPLPPLPAGTPASLRHLVTQALSIQPDQRPVTLAQVQAALSGQPAGQAAGPAQTAQAVRVPAHQSWLMHLAVGDDVVVTAGADQQIRVYTLQGQPVRHLDGLTGRPVGLAVLPSGIVAADARGRVHAWVGGSYRWGDSGGALEHCVPLGETQVVTVSDRPALGLWRVPEVQALGTAPLQGSWVTALGASPSSTILYGTGRGEVMVFDPKNMTQMPLGTTLQGPVTALAAGEGGQVYAAAGRDLWQLGAGTVATLPAVIQALALAPDGRLYVAAGGEVFRAGRGHAMTRVLDAGAPIRALACTQDLVLAGTETGHLVLQPQSTST
ncbi:serine/threonine-protein kinase [Deinococcus aquaedulcis]|uniref:hypothetical protein n=1 Tax=Deinococcus aquaedulcis TaxID=2840455 RepID=UPI001C8350CF|nr:hypothetical protein [Deinococcus aquaedulcis]